MENVIIAGTGECDNGLYTVHPAISFVLVPVLDTHHDAGIVFNSGSALVPMLMLTLIRKLVMPLLPVLVAILHPDMYIIMLTVMQ